MQLIGCRPLPPDRQLYKETAAFGARLALGRVTDMVAPLQTPSESGDSVSYDLAIWEGERPSDDAIAGIVYQAHMEVMELNEEPPTPRIRAYIEVLLARWPELGEADDVPWAMSPLMEQAGGPIAYLNLVYSMADEASAFAANLAQQHGLICYDPQTQRLRL